MTKIISFKSILSQPAIMKNAVNKLIHSAEDLTTKGLKNIKNGITPDEKIKTDFDIFTENAKTFAANFEHFRETASFLQRKMKEKTFTMPSSIELKKLVSHTRELNLKIEEFESILNYMRSKIKSNNLHLKWWNLETAVKDIMHTSGKILFTAREISKL